MEIETGHVYRAKKPGVAGGCYVNDRQVTWCNEFHVQYDSPAVANGRHYPKVSRASFEKWAGEDITGKLPDGAWLDWINYRESKKA